MVTVCPEIEDRKRGSSGDGLDGEEFLLLASDGLWDVFENEEAGKFFVSQLPVGVPFEQVTCTFMMRRILCS